MRDKHDYAGNVAQYTLMIERWMAVMPSVMAVMPSFLAPNRLKGTQMHVKVLMQQKRLIARFHPMAT